MIIGLIVCCVFYVAFGCISWFALKKTGNIFNIFGIILADFMILYSLGSITSSEWIVPLVCGIVHLLFGLAFCYLVGIIDKKIMEYKRQKGYLKNKKPRTKGLAILFAILFGWCGGHKFYLGKKGEGAIYVMFCYAWIPMIVGWIEAIRYMTMSKEEFDDYYNRPLGIEVLQENQVGKLDNRQESEENKDEYDESHIEPVEEPRSKYNVENLQINIGSASIEGEDREKLKILIKNVNGKTYEFMTAGSVIEKFKTAGQPEKSYGEV